jgi:ABC-type nitrate/sulfonate/bicarbonate transport system permease component
VTTLDLPRSTGIDRRGLWVRLGRGLGSAALSIVMVVVVWKLFLVVFDVDPFVGRTPSDVWAHLVTAPDAAAHREELVRALLVTWRDALLGLVAGTLVALVGAVCFDRWRPVGRAVMPLAIGLQSVPLVALTPLIALVFGRGLATTTVIAGLVTFFPTLVIVNLALGAVPRPTSDLLRAYGASRSATLRLAQIPGALPALLASFRITMPLALVGALLAEWLVTGEGLGFLMLRSTVTFQYDQLWAAAWLVTACSIVLYSIVAAVERSFMAFHALP